MNKKTVVRTSMEIPSDGKYHWKSFTIDKIPDTPCYLYLPDGWDAQLSFGYAGSFRNSKTEISIRVKIETAEDGKKSLRIDRVVLSEVLSLSLNSK